ncbi:hypothetical protein CWI39_1340p0010 [Hamiltosporidium magnivora]|uniref:Uncharacterized protein n=1 Tax=Hamiltosporidium magnivora TaxID=148818 RepID=A0A4V2JU84_9MICR|nr:hypothetical protein CWI39_2097p0010 [Hamiltosporidium magnivora]TBU01636.1 hypothetical protein CWI39_1340p0010 [Hamiltosporidium magnivora]
MNNFSQKYLILVLNGLSFLFFLATVGVVFYAVNFKNMSISSFFFGRFERNMKYFVDLNEKEIKKKVFDGKKVLLTVDDTINIGEYKMFKSRFSPKFPTVIILEKNIFIFPLKKSIKVMSVLEYKDIVIKNIEHKISLLGYLNPDKRVLSSILNNFKRFVETSHPINKYIPKIIFTRYDSTNETLYLSMDACYKLRAKSENEILNFFEL